MSKKVYRVYKEGAARASRVFDNLTDARLWVDDRTETDYRIDEEAEDGATTTTYYNDCPNRKHQTGVWWY